MQIYIYQEAPLNNQKYKVTFIYYIKIAPTNY